jgi:hypothetical protein
MTRSQLSAEELFHNYQLLSQKEKQSFDHLFESSNQYQIGSRKK